MWFGELPIVYEQVVGERLTFEENKDVKKFKCDFKKALTLFQYLNVTCKRCKHIWHQTRETSLQ